MSCLLAIDQSTSATKAILFGADGTPLDKTSLNHRQIYPQPGWVEHDAEEIWRNTLAVLKTLMDRNRDRVAELLCLSIANQRETILVFDRATGAPLHNAIVWQCRRGDPICAALRAQGREPMIREKTGLKIDSYFSASKLTWLIRHRPEIAEKLKSGEALIGTVDAYLIHRFTGGTVFATDHTNACRTLLYDIRRLDWDEELCALFEVPTRALPEVRDCAARFGETNTNGILPKAVPICGVMGDSHASLFGQRCFEPGMAKITIGTGSSVLLNTGDTPRFSESGAVTTLGWVNKGKPVYCFEGIINYSAATLEWLKNQLGLIADAREAGELASAVEDNGGVYLVPAFAGLSAPHWNPEARAAILGLSAHSNRNHVIRAAEESIAYQLRDVLNMMQEDAGVPLRRIHADGGATKDAFLMQFIADMAGIEVAAAELAERSPFGAAMAGALGVGLFQSMEELAAQTRKERIFRPAMEAGIVERNYAGWKRAVQRVL